MISAIFNLFRFPICLMFALMLALQQMAAQPLTFPNNFHAFVDWADIDQDGDPDLLYSYRVLNNSQAWTRLALNTNGSFAFAADTITQTFGFVKWGDFDNDGDLDFAQLGAQPGIYENTGNLTFSKLPTVLPAYKGELDWGDYDNDGDLDLAIAGNVSGNWYDTAYIHLFQNDAGGFSELTGFNPVANPLFDIKDIQWVDYDVDGDLDLTFSMFGYSGQAGRKGAILLENNGGIFADLGLTMKGLRAAWGDIDQDGDPDVNCGRNFNNASQSISYLQTLPGVFQDSLLVSLGGLAHMGLSKLGDWDNDGDLDWMIAGGLDATPVTGRLLNNSGGSFSPGTSFASFKSPVSGGFADTDGDGDLDFLISGVDGFTGSETYATLLYQNSASISNTPPSIPSGLAGNISGGNCANVTVIFQWNPATDNETASAGLTYHLRVGTSPGGHEVFSGAKHWQPGPGNVQQNTSWTIENLNLSQPLYWSVEAVDNSFATSGFAPEQVLLPPGGNALFADAGISFPGIGVGSLEWGDFDADGDLDILASGDQQINGPGTTRLYRNDGGSFSLVSPLPFANLKEGSARFIDFDRDNDLDVILMGRNSSNTPLTILYQNASGTYLPVLNPNFTGLYRGSLSVADYDDNGYADVVAMGLNAAGTPQTILYSNIDGTLEQSGIPLTGLYDGDISWHDRSDRFPDLVISGKGFLGDAYTFYYQNIEGDLTQVGSNNLLSPMAESAIAANNRDGAGFYEYVVMGSTSSSPQTFAYVFDDQTESLPGFLYGDIVWIDFDSDGDNDLAMTGLDLQSNQVQTRLYQNINDSYSLVCGAVPEEGNDRSRLAVADFDQDGDLDLMFTSFDGNGQAFGRLYQNDNNAVNTPPSLPPGFSLSANCNVLELSWDPANDNESPSHALSYAVKAGTNAGGNDIYPGQALSDGSLLLTGEGNNGSLTSVRIPVSASGMYYVGVQTIDNGFEASGFLIDSIAVVIVPDSQLVVSEVPIQFPRANSRGQQIRLFDLDENGYPDVFTKTRRGSNIPYVDSTWVLLNDGSSYSLDTLFSHDEISTFVDFDDFNGDGQIDLLYTVDFSPIIGQPDSTYIYPGLGNGAFGAPVKDTLPDFLSVSSGQVVDYNHDGNTDLLVSEQNLASKPYKILYYDDSRAVLDVVELDSSTYTSTFFRSLNRFQFDLNSDGYADLVVGKRDSATFFLFRRNPLTYINDQNGGFTLYDHIRPDTAAIYPHLEYYPGDLDNDGDQDLIARYLIGEPGTPDRRSVFRFMRNDGNLVFTTLNLASTEDSLVILAGPGAVFDFDNDGDLDILTLELSLSGSIHLIENFGNFEFHERKLCLDYEKPSLILTDLNGDQNMDLIGISSGGIAPVLRQATYQTASPNVAPSAPSGLTAVYRPADSVLTLSWLPSTDDKTPAPGLSYNLRMGSAPGVADIIHPLSVIDTGNPLDGRRLITEIGNAFQQTAWNFHKVKIGVDYYWSVQAIDHSYAGSAFGAEHIAASNRSNGNGAASGTMGTGNPDGRYGAGRSSGLDVPIPDAWIALTDDLSGDTLLVDKTDSQGHFDFLNLLSGDYRIVAAYNNLPMHPDNPVLSLSSGNETFAVTVLASTDYIYVVIDSVTSRIQSGLSPDKLLVYPNPAEDLVVIEYPYHAPGSAEVQLVNMLGECLTRQPWDGFGKMKLDLSPFPSGFYLLNFVSPTGTLSRKLVIN
ncbi:MAG: T9SS type A sorting domain-containing protein [Bacteroidia bacterium]